MLHSTRVFALAVALLASPLVAGCKGSVIEPPARIENAGAGPATPRLTADQYRSSVAALLGPGLPIGTLEGDTAPFLFTTIGAAQTTISPDGVRYWEDAALAASNAVFLQDPTRRREIVGCDPVTPGDECVRSFLVRFGRKVWRRPLQQPELDRYVAVSTQLAGADPWKGIYYAVAGLLQSPRFLYRSALGEPDPNDASRQRYTGWEMASRLSFLLWNTTPDDELLDAAERGELVTADGVRVQAMRLLEDERSRAGVRSFFAQYFQLGALDQLNRDPAVYPQMTPTLGASMREEVSLMVEDIVFEHDADIRELFATRMTQVNTELASLYGLPPVAPEQGFVHVELPPEAGRAGLLTTAGILAATSHPDRTSPTRRGLMVRALFCETVPPPPPNAMTDLPPEEMSVPGAPAPTLRERLERHRTDPVCAACHGIMDPIGLGLEEFDSIGVRRTMEAGRPVDTRGEINRIPFNGGVALGEIVRTSETVPRCMLGHLYRYAIGRVETEDEARSLDIVNQRIADLGYGFKDMLLELVTSETFRYLPAAAPPPTSAAEVTP